MNGGGPNDSSSGAAESRNFQDADDVVARLLKDHKDHQIKTEDEDIAAVVDRQLSSSFGGGSITQELSDCADLGAELGNHEANREEEDDADMIAQPRICRICHKMDDRPVLHFAPVEYEMNVAAASPHVQTFPLDIALHVFCGKTASILPNVNQPEYEILTKAGIKNKHGIGGEVNAALSRTRCAVLHEGAGKEKQFYLVREFEAHLAAVRGYIQSSQQQAHYNVTSAAVASMDPPSTTRSSFGSNHTLTFAALTPTSSSSNAAPSFHGGGGSGGSLPGSTMLASLSGNGTLVSSPLGPPQPPSLSNFMMSLGSASISSNNNTSSLDQIYSSGADLLNNSNGSPTLDQIESMIQQQQQLQQLQQSTTSALFSNSASINSSSSNTKVIPMKAGHVHTKHSPPQLNVPDFKVSCDCGGTHLSPHTPSGISSWKRHLTTKRHQKYLQDQQQLQFQMENSSTSSSVFGAAV
jgi:hypothetical protein